MDFQWRGNLTRAGFGPASRGRDAIQRRHDIAIRDAACDTRHRYGTRHCVRRPTPGCHGGGQRIGDASGWTGAAKMRRTRELGKGDAADIA